jgi:hypothetical protein
MAELFVSYKSADRRRVAPLVEGLRAAGLDLWWDQEIAPGAAWRETIASQLDGARLCLAIWTEASIGPGGRFVREEAERALARGAYLGIMLDGRLPPLGFGESQAADLSDWNGGPEDSHIDYLVGVIRARLHGEEPVPGSGRPQPTRSRRPLMLKLGAALACLLLIATLLAWLALPLSPAAFARRELSGQPCSWVAVDQVVHEQAGDRIYLSGAAPSPTALRIGLGRAATAAGLRLSAIDVDAVAAAPQGLCGELELLRRFRAERSRLQADQPQIVSPGFGRFNLGVDVRGIAPYSALFGLDSESGLAVTAPNAAQIHHQAVRSDGGREWIPMELDHGGWSAMVLLTSTTPIETAFIERANRESDQQFVDEFERRAAEGNWRFELAAVDCDLSRPVGQPC